MKKILVIEDDAAIREGLVESLRQEHYELETGQDGEEGLKKGRKKDVDLIILDLLLPRLNGEEVCRSLREEGVVTPILILTSKKEETSKVLGLELGADDYVTKPFSLLELKARIKAIMRRGNRKVERAGVPLTISVTLVNYYGTVYVFIAFLVGTLFWLSGIFVLLRKRGDVASVVYHFGAVAVAGIIMMTWGSFAVEPRILGQIVGMRTEFL